MTLTTPLRTNDGAKHLLQARLTMKRNICGQGLNEKSRFTSSGGWHGLT
jgi:hypothetical protein